MGSGRRLLVVVLVGTGAVTALAPLVGVFLVSRI